MNCPKCGGVLEEDAKFCIYCGEKIEEVTREEAPAQESPMKAPTEVSTEAPTTEEAPALGEKKAEKEEKPIPLPEGISGITPENILHNKNHLNSKKLLEKVFIPGLVVGTLLILIGIMRIMSSGTSISSTSFGGDFYTYTYRGIVAISEILASIEVSIGWLIVAIGAAIDIYSIRR